MKKDDRKKARKFLSRYAFLKDEVIEAEEDLKFYRANIGVKAIDYLKDRVASSLGSSQTESMVLKIEKAEKEYIQRISKLNAMRKQIEDVIVSLEPVQRAIIIQHYIHGKAFNVIADNLPGKNGNGYSYARIYELHLKALDVVANKIDRLPKT